MGVPQGNRRVLVSEAYLNGTSQGPTPEDARKDGHIRGRSKRFMKHPVKYIPSQCSLPGIYL
jgi:hypothetical protein